MFKRPLNHAAIAATLGGVGHAWLGRPNAQQSGQIHLNEWTILRQPGNASAYFPGRHAPGARVKFRRGEYVVGQKGELRRVRA